jgi:hypothetical protein
MRNHGILALMCVVGLAWPVAASQTTAAQAVAVGNTAPVVPASTATAPTTIVGAWRFDPDLSDKPGQPGGGGNAQGGGRRYGGRGGGRMGGGFGGGGGMRGGGGGGMDPQAMQARFALMREIMQPADQLTITLSSDNKSVSMTYADGRVFEYKADGSKEKHQLTNGTVETKTKWDGPTLETEYDLDGGFKIVRDYALSEKSHQLVITTKMEGGRMRQGREMKAIYDAATQ